MKVKALVSFSGQFSMGIGEIAECPNKVILQDLLKAGYVIEAGKQTTEKASEETEEVVKPKKRVKKS